MAERKKAVNRRANKFGKTKEATTSTPFLYPSGVVRLNLSRATDSKAYPTRTAPTCTVVDRHKDRDRTKREIATTI